MKLCERIKNIEDEDIIDTFPEPMHIKYLINKAKISLRLAKNDLIEIAKQNSDCIHMLHEPAGKLLNILLVGFLLPKQIAHLKIIN